ncbi:MAG: IS110 family transposase [Actinomycetota bacterium]|nr:IS110 family transposase [Actinomycetota bacterium]
MDVLYQRCAGLDVSKRDAKACVRVTGAGGKATQTITTWTSMTNQVRALGRYLLEERVGLVVIEATSDYWRQFYFLLEEAGLNVELVNARDAKNLPGRKTDVSDAAWLAQLGAHGLVRSCFVPPADIRQLRELTRTRTAISDAKSREIQRLEKFLESSGIKLSSVATDIVGVSGRAMLEALIRGEEDPAALADLAKASMRSKIPILVEALTGRFNDQHRFMTQLLLDRIDANTKDLERVDARLEELMVPFQGTRELLMSIPGISNRIADVIIAETGADMSVFPTAGHLASWAGTAPGANESAGRIKSTKTRSGNRYIKRALGTAALSLSRSQTTYLGAKYRRIKSRRGPMKALVAVEHSVLIAIWHMLTNGEFYTDPGPDYFTKRQPARSQTRAIAQLQALGYAVTLTPLPAAG